MKSVKKQQKERFQLFGLLGLALVALFMAIGFAAYTQTLNISGTANVGASVWSVKWDADSFAEEGTVDTTSHTITDDTITYACTLTVGQDCSFDIEAINEGTYDAKLSSITVSGPTTTQQKYISVAIWGHTSPRSCWTTNTSRFPDCTLISYGTATNVASNNITLVKKNGSTVGRYWFEVLTSYVQPTNASDLPSSAQSVTVNFIFKWDQA